MLNDHSKKDSFFQNVQKYLQRISVIGPNLCVGDFDSRLYCKYVWEGKNIWTSFLQKRANANGWELGPFYVAGVSHCDFYVCS